MRSTAIHIGSAPSSANAPSSDDAFSTDGGRDSSTDGDRKRRRGGRRGRKGDKNNKLRGMGEKKIFTPVVKVLLFGVLLSFLDALYIIKQLEESSEVLVATPNASTAYLMKAPSINYIESSKVKTNNKQSDNKNNNDPLADREPIIKLIRDAGISFDPVEDADLILELPTWSEVVEMYGPEPVIYGINEGNCQRFQAQTDPGDHFIGTAGTFNTGTNLMSELLIQNCVMPERVKKHGPTSRGIRWQVPWGKHSPSGDKEYRTTHKTEKDKLVDANEVMPMVTIRDPLVWMKSMCRHKYTAIWEGFKETDHCPNFLRKNLVTKVRYSGFIREYESLIHLWNDYYEDYKNIDVPFLLVRFEDLVFHAEETITKVCECAGGKRSTKFHYIVSSAKKGHSAHGVERTGYVDALVKYGTLAKRYKGYDSIEDLTYVKDNVDAGLMEMMQYSSVDLSWPEEGKEVTEAVATAAMTTKVATKETEE